MALTPEGAALTEQHRQRQLALRAVVIAQLLQLWPNFNVAEIDASWERMEPAVMAIVSQGRKVSEALSTVYFRQFREAERVSGVVPNLTLLDNAWETAARVSLRVTGPVAAKQLVSMNSTQVAEKTLVRLGGSVVRIVSNGGRDALRNAVKHDRRAIGYARVTALKPCAFCALLASRGPVYKSRESADFEAHDHCSCQVEPVYFRDAAWPGRGREFQALYKESTRGKKDLLNSFRHAYERSVS
jgi:hypothetical protein